MQTTKVTMLRNPASSAKCNLSEGETGDVPSSQAEWLIAMGLAVLVDTPKEIKGVPDRPSLVAVENKNGAIELIPETKPQGNSKARR